MLDGIGDQSFRTRSSMAGLMPIIRHPVGSAGSFIRSAANEVAVVDEEEEEETWSDVSA